MHQYCQLLHRHWHYKKKYHLKPVCIFIVSLEPFFQGRRITFSTALLWRSAHRRSPELCLVLLLFSLFARHFMPSCLVAWHSDSIWFKSSGIWVVQGTGDGGLIVCMNVKVNLNFIPSKVNYVQISCPCDVKVTLWKYLIMLSNRSLSPFSFPCY